MSKVNYIDRARKYMRHEKLSIIPAPDRVLIKITKQQMDDLISKEVKKEDGTSVRIFFEPIHFSEGFERRFQQNISAGKVIGVGDNVRGVHVGDIAILDYLVSNLTEDMIGYERDGSQLISILAHTTYHEKGSGFMNGRQAWVKGDFDNISRILGLVREDKLIPFDPYVFLEYKPDYIKILSMRGEAMRSSEAVVSREIIATPEDCIYKFGDLIKLKKDDWFDREISRRIIAICFKQDILCKING